MPRFLEKKLEKEYGKHSKAVYAVMNKIGAMHGSKETAKGRAMEEKHEISCKACGKKMKTYAEKTRHHKDAHGARSIM